MPPWLRAGLLVALVVFVAGAAVALGAAVLLGGGDDGRPRGATSGVLRLSGSQFLLNWQSFPGREAVIEFCTIRAAAGKDAACLVFNGAQRLGEIDIDGATFDPASSAWAEKTCRRSDPSVACSIRLAGTIRRGPTGSALIVGAKVLP